MNCKNEKPVARLDIMAPAVTQAMAHEPAAAQPTANLLPAIASTARRRRWYGQILVGLVLLWCSCGQWSPAQSPNTSTKKTIRVLSYNIHHAEGVDGKLDLPRIAKVIESVQPDIVALQEVDSKVQRSKSVNQPQELAQLVGMQVLFGGNIELQGGQYGNAVLTKGELGKSTNHRLPNIDAGEQRGLLDVMLTLDGKSVRLLATHFDHRRDPRERLASIEVANQLAKAGGNTPTLLVGDLNAEFESEVLKKAREVWTVTNEQRMPTIPVDKPQRQIDFVLTYPAGAWQVKEVKVLDEAVASDHRAILAVLEL